MKILIHQVCSRAKLPGDADGASPRTAFWICTDGKSIQVGQTDRYPKRQDDNFDLPTGGEPTEW